MEGQETAEKVSQKQLKGLKGGNMDNRIGIGILIGIFLSFGALAIYPYETLCYLLCHTGKNPFGVISLIPVAVFFVWFFIDLIINWRKKNV